MSLQETWYQTAFTPEGGPNQKVWDEFSPLEEALYKNILANKIQNISGTVKELAEKHNMTTLQFVGFLDGISEALPEKLDVSEIEEDSSVQFNIDFEVLYKKMVEYKAEKLFKLPEWLSIYDEHTLKKFFTEQRNSTTIVKEPKVGRNEPCPCGSGKKYKKCCGI